jgi:hypothetical protein
MATGEVASLDRCAWARTSVLRPVTDSCRALTTSTTSSECPPERALDESMIYLICCLFVFIWDGLETSWFLCVCLFLFFCEQGERVGGAQKLGNFL